MTIALSALTIALIVLPIALIVLTIALIVLTIPRTAWRTTTDVSPATGPPNTAVAGGAMTSDQPIFSP